MGLRDFTPIRILLINLSRLLDFISDKLDRLSEKIMDYLYPYGVVLEEIEYE